MNTTPERYRALRKSVGGLIRVSKILGVSQSTLERREGGHVNLRPEHLIAMIHVAECMEHERDEMARFAPGGPGPFWPEELPEAYRREHGLDSWEYMDEYF